MGGALLARDMSYWWLDVQMWMWDKLLWFFILAAAFVALTVVWAVLFGKDDDRR